MREIRSPIFSLALMLAHFPFFLFACLFVPDFSVWGKENVPIRSIWGRGFSQEAELASGGREKADTVGAW